MSFLGDVWDWVGNTAGSAVDTVESTASSVVDGAETAATSVYDVGAGAVSGVYNDGKSVVEWGGDTVGGLVGATEQTANKIVDDAGNLATGAVNMVNSLGSSITSTLSMPLILLGVGAIFLAKNSSVAATVTR